MAVGIVLLVALPVVMIVDRDGTYRAIMSDQPELDPSNLDFAFYAVMIFAGAIHAIFAVLTLWFGIKSLKGRRWGRIALTAYLVLATIGGFFSASAVPAYLWVVIPADTIHIVMIVLLWASRSVRDFFDAHRCRVTAA